MVSVGAALSASARRNYPDFAWEGAASRAAPSGWVRVRYIHEGFSGSRPVRLGTADLPGSDLLEEIVGERVAINLTHVQGIVPFEG